MATNSYFRLHDQNANEVAILEDLNAEAIQMFGIDLYYMPRKLMKTDPIFGEDILSKFDDVYQIEMYIENVDQFGGDRDIYAKFGIEVHDELTLIVSRHRFHQAVGAASRTAGSGTILREVDQRPREGDLLYFPFNKGLFELTYVEDEEPWYPLGSLTTYKLTCKLFEYSQETIDTPIVEIDKINQDDDITTPSDTPLLPPVEDVASAVIWTSSTAYVEGQEVYPPAPATANVNRFYRVIVAGTTGTSEPVWDTIVGDKVYDGSVVYIIQGAYNENEVIEQEVEDIIDWSEDNPFGSY